MKIETALKTIFHDMQPVGNISFKPGQIFYGKVQQLFPNQLAKMQIGSHTLLAKLEIPLKQGEGYWVQVSSDVGEQRLKLLASRDAGMKENSPAALLQQLSMPNEKQNRLLAQFLMTDLSCFQRRK
ncbi:hypothetical protein ACI2OX_13275 [Bacillus sp. N9]